MPRPFELARDCVVAAHFPRRLRHRAVVRNARTDHYRIANDGRWRCFFVVGKTFGPRRNTQSLPKTDDSVVPERRGGLAGSRVEPNQTGVDGRDEDSALFARPPGRDAAAGEIDVAHITRHLGIVRPALGAGHRIERDHSSQRRRQIERSFDIDRRRFERRRAAAGWLIRVTGVECPGGFKPPDVHTMDDGERRIALPARIAAVVRPFPIRHRLKGISKQRQEKDTRSLDHWTVHGDQFTVRQIRMGGPGPDLIRHLVLVIGVGPISLGEEV